MKDIYIPKKVPRIEVREKLHGHTTIDLFNVRTKKYERVEHDNAFTDGIDSFIKENGVFMSGLAWGGIKQSKPFLETILGGILLFDTALPTSPMAKYMPAGTTMVANGSYGVSNAGNPIEMGSYNTIESVIGDNSCSFVYDWLTSQGNGEIASVALTTKNGGYIGYGNVSLSNNTLKYLYADFNDTYSVPPVLYRSNSFRNAKNAKLFYSNKFYACANADISQGTTSVTIKYRNFSIQNFDVFENGFDGDISSFPNTMTFSVPSLPSAYRLGIAGNAYPSCFLLVPNATVSIGAQFALYLLDVSDGTVTTLTITNNTGHPLSALYYYIIDDTYLVVRTNDSPYEWAKVNYTTSAFVGMATNSASRGVYEYTRGLITDSLLSVSSDHWIYDPVKNRFLPTNGALCGTGTRAGATFNYLGEYDACQYMGYGGDTGSPAECLSVLAHPLRLMTINNLDSPVTKTADKTMKVTYTVTRSS